MFTGNLLWSVLPGEHAGISSALAAAAQVKGAKSTGLPLQMVGSSAVVSITGYMIDGPSWLAEYGFAVTRDIIKAVDIAANDRSVSEIIILTKSPGGSTSGMADLGDAIARATAIKPTRGAVQGLAASAAYYAIANTTRISAGRMDIVGSIGTYAVLVDTSEAYKMAGYKPILVTSGGVKGSGADGVVTPELIESVQKMVDSLTNDFVSTVASGRKLSFQQAQAVATGDIWTGTEAMTNGLIDTIETANALIDRVNSNSNQMQIARAKLTLAQLY
jgi:signal peptide peptidase SppA